MSCALCHSNSPLQNSHILPEFFYTPVYDQIHRFQVITSAPSESERFKQKGVHEKLLCKACEQKLSLWEKYAKETFGDGVGLNVVRDGNILNLSNLDYRSFRLFLLSLLWRMGVSKMDLFAEMNLGSKHQEYLRVALLREDPLEPLHYPCLVFAVYIGGKFHRDWISQPMRMRSGGHRCHCVVINGILFCFYIARGHSLPAIFRNVCISKKNEMRIVIGDIESIPFLAEYASKLGVAIRARKRSGKGSLRSP